MTGTRKRIVTLIAVASLAGGSARGQSSSLFTRPPMTFRAGAGGAFAARGWTAVPPATSFSGMRPATAPTTNAANSTYPTHAPGLPSYGPPEPYVPTGEVWSPVPAAGTLPAATRTIQRVSMIALRPPQPKRFRVNDLISIIVRQRRKYESDSTLDTEKKWDINAKLSEWFRFYPRHRLGSDNLSNGDPSAKFNFKNKLQGEGEFEREDKFTTRMTARIIDVKPNGVLVLEARARERHDDEEVMLTITGMCRSKDVLPDNTVLSTQLYDLNIAEGNTGAMRDVSRRGWIPRALDFLRPF